MDQTPSRKQLNNRKTIWFKKREIMYYQPYQFLLKSDRQDTGKRQKG